MESVEASGKSIEDAILQALVRLGRNRDEVDITVLQEPSRGTRGMGAREARVRVFVRPARVAQAAPGVVTPDMADQLFDEEDGVEAEGDEFEGDELYAVEEVFAEEEEFEEPYPDVEP